MSLFRYADGATTVWCMTYFGAGSRSSAYLDAAHPAPSRTLPAPTNSASPPPDSSPVSTVYLLVYIHSSAYQDVVFPVPFHTPPAFVGSTSRPHHNSQAPSLYNVPLFLSTRTHSFTHRHTALPHKVIQAEEVVYMSPSSGIRPSETPLL